ncbi:MAG: branched-chain amino acid ABC transporter permease [Planctomycetaceae bacterium]
MDKFLQTLMDGFTVGSLYALIALGYTMVYGILQFINFAHGDVFALGVHLTIVFAAMLGIEGLATGGPASLPVVVGVLLLTMLACGCVGFLIERLAYRPLRSSPRLNVLITAIGVSLLLQNVGQLPFVFGPYRKATPNLLPDVTLATIGGEQQTQDDGTLEIVGGVKVTLVNVTVVLVALAMMLALQYVIHSTRFGLAMRAVSHDPRTAGLMGINVDLVISLTFMIGSMLAAGAGFLYTLKYTGNVAHPGEATWVLLGLKAFVAAVVGGIGNIRGAVLGGLLIGLTEFFGVGYLSSEYRDAYVFAILIVVLLVRPQGILGRPKIEKV